MDSIYSPDVIARFESKVDRSGGPNACHMWMAGRFPNGYGQFFLAGQGTTAQRIAWEIANNRRIPPNMCICHHCDVRGCVNPQHLFLGDAAANVADKTRKGRQAKGDRNGSRLYPERLPHGEAHWKAKLTEAEVREIRRTHAMGAASYTVLAQRYGVTKAMIGFIIRRTMWRHVS